MVARFLLTYGAFLLAAYQVVQLAYGPRAFSPLRLWHLILMVLLAAIAAPACEVAAPFVVAMIAAVVLGLFRFWSREFQYLMGLEDGAFPGRNDKVIWVLLLALLPPVGMLVFRSYRRAHWPEEVEPVPGPRTVRGMDPAADLS